MSLLPPEFSSISAKSCFSTLWTPEGRGSVHNIALIEWIDYNAWFKVGKWTLREWSQLRAKEAPQPAWKRTVNDIISGLSTPRKQHTIRQLNEFIDVLDRVLSSGMRLATLLFLDYSDSLVMVHPEAQESDLIYYLRGCSIPVVLRETASVDGSKQYRVVGGAYLHDEPWSFPPFGSRRNVFSLYRDWVAGKNPEALENKAEDLILC